MNHEQFLNQHLAENPELQALFLTLFSAVQQVSLGIDITKGKQGTQNVFGEDQLEMDVFANLTIQKILTTCSCVSLVANEENEEVVKLNGDKFAVVYDPLDGSSLIDANLSVGSIFGIYPGDYLHGRKGSEMVGSMYAIYGPRTTVVMSFGKGVHLFILKKDSFELVRENITIAETGRYFAPGNLRACKTEAWYRNLFNHWLDKQYTLRYSGGMAPDINHIFAKGEGVFTYPGYKGAPDGKLRLLYECGPMAYIVEQAGGKATDGFMRILDKEIISMHQQTPIFIGSKREVEIVEEFLMGDS